MAIRMQQRRGTSTQWTNANPVLGEGEIGWESNTNKFKIGDGVNEWADLPYFLDEDTLEGAVDDFIPLTQKGAANGVATLDVNGKLTSSQVPNIDELAQDAVDAALTAGTGITKTYNDNANTLTIAVDTATIAPLSGPTFTGTVTLPSTTSIGDVSATEIGYVNGVTSAIQTQLDGKAASSHTHAQSDITNLTTDLAAKLSLAGGTMTGALTLAGAPSQALEAATKAYVDAVSEGLHIHPSVVAATTASLNISTDLEPGDVVDGVTLAEGNRVLVKNQTNAAQNGIYVVQASGAALRASDFNEPQEVDGGDFVFVTGGTLGDNTGWVQTATSVVTIGTDPITFTQFSGAGTYQAGTGLTLTDNVFSVNQSVIAPLAGPTFTGTVTLPSTTSIGDVSATEIGYVNGVTSAIQTQLDGKAASSHTHAQSDITNLTTDLAAKANLAGPTFTGTVTLPSTTSIGDVSSTELGYLDGVTSSIQSQLNSKANLSGASFTGNISTTGTISGTAAVATAATAASRVGYMGIPASGAGASGAYTLVEADAGELVYTTSSRTVTIPANASVPFQIGTTIVFISGAGATTTIAIDTDTLLLAGAGTTGSRTLAAHGMATAVKVASTTWYISGNGLT